MADRIGVLDASGLWMHPGHEADAALVTGDPGPHSARTIRQLLTLIERNDLDQLWLHSSWAVPAGLPIPALSIEDARAGVVHPFVAAAKWATNDSPPGAWGMRRSGLLRPWMRFYRRGESGTVALAIPHLDPRMRAWSRAEDGAALLAAVILYQRALRGYTYRSGPGATGTGLMRALHRGNATSLDLSTTMTPADFPPPARALAEGKPDVTPQIGWMRRFTAGEARQPYIHSYDKNGMYLAASSSLRVGFGAPTHLTLAGELEGALEAITSARKPIRRPIGYWLATVAFDDPPEAIAHGLLPHPCITSTRDPDPAATPRWYHSATLTLAGELGARIAVTEAYLWPQGQLHEPLEPWYQRLRDARAELMALLERQPKNTPASIALAAVKMTYAHAIGWLDPNWLRTSPDPEDLYRPDWRHAIQSTANANLWRNLYRVYRGCGRAPFAITVDAAHYTADDPDPVAQAPAGLRLGPGLGQFKVHLAALPTEALAPAWALLDKGRPMDRALAQYGWIADAHHEGKDSQ